MGKARSLMEKLGAEALAIGLGTLAGIIIGAAFGFAVFAVGEYLGEAIFGFEGFGEGPWLDMAPRSRLRGGFLVFGAIAGIPASWWWMRRMEKADEADDEG